MITSVEPPSSVGIHDISTSSFHARHTHDSSPLLLPKGGFCGLQRPSQIFPYPNNTSRRILRPIATMASPKPAVELPRFLLVSNIPSSRLTYANLLPSSLSSYRQSSPPTAADSISTLPSRRPLSTLTYTTTYHLSQSRSTTAAPRRFLHSISHRSHPQQRPRNRSPSIPTSASPPIRHNGVYVATFKPARRAFHASAVRARDHRFDTLRVVQRLKDEGFSEEQAVALMRVLNDVIEESIQNLTRTMVLKEGE